MKFETLQLHAGQEIEKTTLSRAVPIYQTTSYLFENSKHAQELFAGEKEGNIYSRIMNPTVDVLEKRIAALEGGTGALAVSSGQSAQFIAITTICKAGENIVSSPYLYGGTYNQFKVRFKDIGIETRFTENLNPESFEKLIDKKTKAIYVESIANLQLNIPDFKAISDVCKKNGIPFIVDNTFGAGGYLIRPIEHGADIVVESATKWIGGHGTSIGGIIVDSGNFEWNNGRFPSFTEPSEGFHGLVWWKEYGSSENGNIAFIAKARNEGLRDYGNALSPFNAFMLLQGVETLSLRVERHCSNAIVLAQWLKSQDFVEDVKYPGLENDPFNNLCKKYFKNGAGGILQFKLKANIEETDRFVDNLMIISHLANIGDAKTLIIHPSTTTHHQLTKEEQLKIGIIPGMLRLSVGIENIEDIKQDILNAWNKVK